MGSNTGSAPYGPFVALNNMAAEAAYRRAMAQQSGKEWNLKKQGLGYFGEGMMGMPGGAPMPPEPGQASVATRPFPTVGDRPITDQSNYAPSPGGIPASATSMDVGMQGLPAGPTPQAGAASQPAVQGRPALSLQQLVAVIKAKHPDADPAAVAEATTYFLPWLQEDDQQRLKEMLYTGRVKLGEDKLQNSRDIVEAQTGKSLPPLGEETPTETPAASPQTSAGTPAPAKTSALDLAPVAPVSADNAAYSAADRRIIPVDFKSRSREAPQTLDEAFTAAQDAYAAAVKSGDSRAIAAARRVLHKLARDKARMDEEQHGVMSM